MYSSSFSKLHNNDSIIISLLIEISLKLKNILKELSNINILDKKNYILITTLILDSINNILLNEYSIPNSNDIFIPPKHSSLSEIFVLLIELEIDFNELLSEINLMPFYNFYQNNKKKYLQSIIYPLSIEIKELIERVTNNLPIIGGRKSRKSRKCRKSRKSKKCRKY